MILVPYGTYLLATAAEWAEVQLLAPTSMHYVLICMTWFNQTRK